VHELHWKFSDGRGEVDVRPRTSQKREQMPAELGIMIVRMSPLHNSLISGTSLLTTGNRRTNVRVVFS